MLYPTQRRCKQLLESAGRGLADEALIIGQAAASLSVGQSWRLPMVQVAVSDELFCYLKRQEDWGTDPDTRTLVNAEKQLTASVLPENHISNRRYWTTANGLQVACLPEVYTDLERQPESWDYAISVRAVLQSRSGQVPNARTVSYLEPEILRLCPDEWQWQPDLEPYLRLLATGMHITYTCYGDPEVEQVNRIFGEVEDLKYGVRALYHNGFDLTADMRWLLRHLQNIQTSPEQSLLALCADAYSDAVFGNGRKRNNPQSYDELRSARLLRSHAQQLGVSPKNAQKMFAAVMGTTFSWETGCQEGQFSEDPIVRSVVGGDLCVLSAPDSVHVTFAVATEDGLSSAFSEDRVLGRAMADRGVEPVSLETALEFIDDYPNDRVEIDGQPYAHTVREWFGNRLAVNAGFHDPDKGYQYPHDWTLEDEDVRFANAEYLRGASARILAGASLQDEYRRALQFTREAYKEYDLPE